VRYVEAFASPAVVGPALAELRRALAPGRRYRLMEFCGGHTHALYRSGLIDLLPAEIAMVHGPGCPVCVLPAGPITAAIDLLERDASVVVATYADLMRVPAGRDSFAAARDRGLDVRPVHGPSEAYALAVAAPERRVVFVAIGFETTTPPTALVVQRAAREGRRNFFVYGQHLQSGAAIDHLLAAVAGGRLQLDGLVGPGHVALVVGAGFFAPFAAKGRLPIVVSGFAPFDLVRALTLLVRQVNAGRAEVEVAYDRAVTWDGNRAAQAAIDDVFEPRPRSVWRGLGELAGGSLRLRPAYRAWDAEHAFELRPVAASDHAHCLCPSILLGERAPLDCTLFGRACTPARPLGPCMVSAEGACAAVFHAGRHLLQRAGAARTESPCAPSR